MTCNPPGGCRLHADDVSSAKELQTTCRRLMLSALKSCKISHSDVIHMSYAARFRETSDPQKVSSYIEIQLY